jgi:hypothetical protein
MLFLIKGNTWYGNYGFRPIKNDTYEIDQYLNKDYENNQKIINNITIKDIDILEYIHMTQNEVLINATIKILKSNELNNILLKDFLYNLFQDYNKNCKLFYIFYEKLYNDLGLKNFHRLLFGLSI